MSSFVFRQGLMVGASSSYVGDLLVVDGVIAQVGASIDAPAGAHEVDATNCWVGPAFVDLHTHLREPGREEAETIESGALAAALGGFGAIMAMPNTEPALDNVALVSYVLERGARSGERSRRRLKVGVEFGREAIERQSRPQHRPHSVARGQLGNRLGLS